MPNSVMWRARADAGGVSISPEILVPWPTVEAF
jgi:hypothetical protein